MPKYDQFKRVISLEMSLDGRSRGRIQNIVQVEDFN